MAEGSDEDKNEEPTDKKRREAREKGQVVQSREVNTWIILATATLLLVWAAGWMSVNMLEFLREFIARPHQFAMDGGAIFDLLSELTMETARVLVIPMGVLFLAAFLSGFVQVGFLISTDSIEPKLEKIDPIRGFKRVFGSRAFFEFLKAFFKLVIVGGITTLILMPIFEASRGMVGLEISGILDYLIDESYRLFMAVCAVLFVLAAIDYAFQYHKNMQQLRMSRQEIRDEYKQSEGDPHIKARLRELRMQRARKRMMAAVPKADVVITNPTHFSVALEYKQDKNAAPIVVAKGQDKIALKIREIARENNVPIVENKPLARALYDNVELDQEIPEEHYKAVAEIISYVYSLKRR